MAPHDEALTDIQRNVLNYVQQHLNESHRPPTVRDIMRHFKWSSPQLPPASTCSRLKKGDPQWEDTRRGACA